MMSSISGMSSATSVPRLLSAVLLTVVFEEEASSGVESS